MKKKIRLHPALVFLLLTLGVMIFSVVGNLLNLEAGYFVVNESTGDLSNVALSNAPEATASANCSEI